MRYAPFHMERWQSTYEHRVRYNLSESGVHPLTVGELLELAGSELSVADVRLGYAQSNGSDELRALIAADYAGASDASVLVTVGGAEANFASFWHLFEREGKAAVVVPTYGQVPGLVDSFGGDVRPVRLLEDRGWQPDLDALATALAEGARFVLVTNPNNPTGAVLSPGAMDAIVGPEAEIAQLWGRTDYSTICPASVSDALARVALAPTTRARIRARTRGIVRKNLVLLEEWIHAQGGRFRHRPPDAGAICFARYDAPINSSAFAEKLRVEKDVLVVPGDHFGMDGFVRIGFGNPADELLEALGRIRDAFDEVVAEASG